MLMIYVLIYALAFTADASRHACQFLSARYAARFFFRSAPFIIACHALHAAFGRYFGIVCQYGDDIDNYYLPSPPLRIDISTIFLIILHLRLACADAISASRGIQRTVAAA